MWLRKGKRMLMEVRNKKYTRQREHCTQKHGGQFTPIWDWNIVLMEVEFEGLGGRKLKKSCKFHVRRLLLYTKLSGSYSKRFDQSYSIGKKRNDMIIFAFWEDQSFWHYYVLNGSAKKVEDQLRGHSIIHVRNCEDFN